MIFIQISGISRISVSSSSGSSVKLPRPKSSSLFTVLSLNTDKITSRFFEFLIVDVEGDEAIAARIMYLINEMISDACPLCHSKRKLLDTYVQIINNSHPALMLHARTSYHSITVNSPKPELITVGGNPVNYYIAPPLLKSGFLHYPCQTLESDSITSTNIYSIPMYATTCASASPVIRRLFASTTTRFAP